MPRKHALTAAVVVVTAVGLVGPAAAAPPPPRTAPPAAAGTPSATGRVSTHSVTLVTGDVVHLSTLPGGRHAVSVQAADPSGRPRFTLTEQDGHVRVVPVEAAPYLTSGQLDRDLFDVTTLVAEGYDDAGSRQLPLLLVGPAAAGRAAATRLPATPPGATRGAELRSIGAVAVREDKSRARAFWAALDDDSGAARPRLAGGVRVALDHRVRGAVATGREQTAAASTAAAASGQDGEGVKVAVLDTGYDPQHPDLAGRVEAAANFTDDPDVTDGFGQGTGMAAVIAGSGASSGGGHSGVAPGARLLVGKVLDHDSVGLTSQIIAGMEWAVAQGARVVNLSLADAPSDGSDELSLAVDRLTASSGALFVAAAGNYGAVIEGVAAPGAATSALTVGASDGDRIAPFSSRGPRWGDSAIKPDLVAPGVDVVTARAAGTGLGTLVDADHVALSGTAVAAAHVSGTAAVLAAEHPDWNAEQLRSALMATAHHLDGPPVAAQGTGRVDLAAATAGQVLPTTGSLALGRLAWTGQARGPVTRTVSYRNGSAEPVTLDLGMDVHHTGGVPPFETPALTVTPQRLTLAPGQSADATVTLDPDATEPGTYAGYVTAQADGDGPVLRTSVGFVVEGQLHELRVEGLDRDGSVPREFVPLHIWNLDTGEDIFATLLDGVFTTQVPAGRYTVVAEITTVDPSGNYRDASLMTDPEVVVTGDTTVRFDARTAHEIRLRTDDPVQPEQYGMSWQRTVGPHSILGGGLYPGWARGYAAQTGPVSTGTFQFFSRWDLTAVPLTAKVHGRGGFALATPRHVDSAPKLDGRLRLPLVDAGLGTSEDFARLDVRGKAVLVDRHANDEGGDFVYQQLQSASEAGARVLFVANDRPGLYQTGGGGDSTVPGYTLYQQDGQRLRALLAGGHEVTLDLDGVAVSPYLYDLMLTEPGGIPADLTYDVGHRNLARRDVDYHAHSDRAITTDSRMAFPPGVDTAFELGRWDPIRPPLQRTEYLSAGDTTWVHHVVADAVDWEGHTYDAPQQFAAGSTGSEVWFPAVTRPAVLGGDPHPAAGSPVSRFADALRFQIPQHVDGAGTEFDFSDLSETTEVTLTRDGVTLGSTNLPVGQFDMPGEGTYQLSMRSERAQDWQQDWWTTSTATSTRWTFRSERPADGQFTVLPLLQVGYDLSTDLWNQVSATGPTRLGLHLAYQPGHDGTLGTDAAMRVAVSYDDGATWHDVLVAPQGTGTFVALVPAPPAGAGFATLRLAATDGHGSRIDQTIDRAYRIAPGR